MFLPLKFVLYGVGHGCRSHCRARTHQRRETIILIFLLRLRIPLREITRITVIILAGAAVEEDMGVTGVDLDGVDRNSSGTMLLVPMIHH